MMRQGLTGLYVVVLLTLAACANIAPFNEHAYTQATSIKVDALALVDKSSQAFARHAAAVTTLEARCEKAYEYAKGLPGNQATIAQWKIITDPKGGSLFAWLALWKSEGKIKAAEVGDAKTQLARHFDQIIELESGKIKSR